MRGDGDGDGDGLGFGEGLRFGDGFGLVLGKGLGRSEGAAEGDGAAVDVGLAIAPGVDEPPGDRAMRMATTASPMSSSSDAWAISRRRVVINGDNVGPPRSSTIGVVRGMGKRAASLVWPIPAAASTAATAAR
jgi:hypothetical protein